MIAFALILAAATLIVGLGVAFGAARLRSVRRQVVAVALTSVVLPLGAVMAGGAVMFSTHDAVVLASLIAAGSAALVGSWLIWRRLVADLNALRDMAQRLAAGDLAARVPETGPREVRAMAAAFNEMASRLEELHDARTRLVSWASHDLRAPITALRAMIEAAQDGVVDSERYLATMSDRVRVLDTMVDDLFQLARLDAGGLALDLRAASVSTIVDDAVSCLHAVAAARGVTIVAEIADALPEVRCAPDHVQRVLDNLLVNAVRHTASEGLVAVRVRPHPPDEIEVSVEDDGVGLSSEALGRMFDHFWRGDPARGQDDAGAGLGLAIARGLVRAQGGQIWAENMPGGGARVAFTLCAAGRGAATLAHPRW